MKTCRPLLLFFVALSLVEARGVTRSWTNTLGGDWFAAANWSPNGVPSGADVANITNDGTYVVSVSTGTVAVAAINLGGASGTQTLALQTVNSTTTAGAVRANGVLAMSSGALLGTWIVQPGGQLQFNSSANKFLDTLNLINQGTVTWNDGQLLNGGQPATVVSNGGQWLMTGDNSFNAYSGSTNPPVWINSGLLRKSGGTGVSQINNFNLAFNPGGTADAQTGTLRFSGNTSNSLAGSFTASSGAAVELYSGTYYDAGGVASGAGINRFTGTTLNLRTNIIPGLLLAGGTVLLGPIFQNAGAITNLALDGATLVGTNRISGTCVVNSGALIGQLTVQSPAGQLLFNTPANKFLDTLNLVNQGTVTWNDGQLLNGGQPATIVSNGGQWLMLGDNPFNAYSGSTNPPVWINSGLLRKSGGTGVSQINNFNLAFNPGGTADAQTGTLRFGGGVSNTLGGSFTASSGAVVELYSGTYYDAGGVASGAGINRFTGTTLNLRTNIIPGLLLAGGTVLLGPGFQNAGAITSLTLDGSTLAGANRVSGTLVVNSGNLPGTLLVQPGGQLQFNTPANKFLDSLNLINQGTVTWNDGQLLNGGQPATIVSNGGQWLMLGDNPFNAYSGSTNPPVWINSGLLRKSGGTGVSQINNFNLAFNPGGTADAQTGTLRFGGSVSNTLAGSFTASSGAVVELYSGTYFDAGGVASGAGINRFTGMTLNLRTNIIPGLLLAGGTVLLGPIFQNAGAITNLTLDGATLVGTNRISGTCVVNSGALIGLLTVQSPAGQLQFNTPANKFLDTLNLVNQGTVTWNDGQLLNGGQPATIVSNGGQWLMLGDNPFNAYSGSTNPPVWINSGLLRKSGGTGVSQINNFNLAFNPGGTADAQTGTLRFGGNTSNTLGGSFTASSGAVVELYSGTYYDAGGVASGAGINRFTGTTLNLRTNIIPGLMLAGGTVLLGPIFQNAGAITNLTLDGATLAGTNRITGTCVVNSGALIGQLTVQSPAGQLLFNTPANKFLDTLNLVNQGTVTWNDGQLLNGGQPATIVSNGGQWLMLGDNSFNAYSGSTNPPVWINSGLLRKSGGTGVSQINNFNFNNQSSGVVQGDTGTISLPSMTTNSTGILRLNGGKIQTSGTYSLTGGTLEGAGSFGANVITGGTVSPGQAGSGLITFTSGLNLGAGAIVSVAGTGTTPGSQYDQLSVVGPVSLGNATLQVTALPSVAPGTVFVIIDNDGVDAVTGTFIGLPENAAVNAGGQPFRIHYAGGTGNDVTLVRDSGAVGADLTSTTYTNGTFRLFAAGGSNVVYGVQASTNFVQWTNLGFATGGAGGAFSFADTNAFRFTHRFYRTTN